MHQLILTFSCDDTAGIVHAVTGAIVACQGNILELQQFSSTDTGRFFMRVEIDVPTAPEEFRAAIAQVATRFAATWAVVPAGVPTRTLVLVSKAAGPLNDLLFHVRAGDLPIEIPLILSNHEQLGRLAHYHGIPFEHHAVLPDSKPAFENRIRQAVDELGIDLVVLARYMQILSPELCTDLAGRVINIHHSFLPGFKGANPYRQAHERGVKLIGATAHFVTSNLDEGPIIEQNVHRVDHSATVAELTSIGQGLESDTLTSAVRLFAEKRIFLDGIRTVIFH
ncbi:formyltetrahydrofolate deformylase [Brooklawnia cerclae]|uniref:Formyltetrahydrofolate deformylase n=1 Tax=Brooklawnia cerclae TaxID=349934 RepID=A0ABX0SC08_9ACTN|nr:formyltetrahydrofolate deformylase [Brooklawnia cerclae]